MVWTTAGIGRRIGLVTETTTALEIGAAFKDGYVNKRCFCMKKGMSRHVFEKNFCDTPALRKYAGGFCLVHPLPSLRVACKISPLGEAMYA